jgi:hypothetical protein
MKVRDNKASRKRRPPDLTAAERAASYRNRKLNRQRSREHLSRPTGKALRQFRLSSDRLDSRLGILQ